MSYVKLPPSLERALVASLSGGPDSAWYARILQGSPRKGSARLTKPGMKTLIRAELVEGVQVDTRWLDPREALKYSGLIVLKLNEDGIRKARQLAGLECPWCASERVVGKAEMPLFRRVTCADCFGEWDVEVYS